MAGRVPEVIVKYLLAERSDGVPSRPVILDRAFSDLISLFDEMLPLRRY